MTESGSIQDITVDRTTQHKVNAGNCEKCGFFKTWDVRVENPKTNKKMPAHVTQEGYLVNGGECPWWTKVKKQNAMKRALKQQNHQQDDAQAPPPVMNEVLHQQAPVQALAPAPSPAPAPDAKIQPSLGPEAISLRVNNGSIVMDIGDAISVRLDRDGFLRILREALNLVVD